MRDPLWGGCGVCLGCLGGGQAQVLSPLGLPPLCPAAEPEPGCRPTVWMSGHVAVGQGPPCPAPGLQPGEKSPGRRPTWDSRRCTRLSCSRSPPRYLAMKPTLGRVGSSRPLRAPGYSASGEFPAPPHPGPLGEGLGVTEADGGPSPESDTLSLTPGHGYREVSCLPARGRVQVRAVPTLRQAGTLGLNKGCGLRGGRRGRSTLETPEQGDPVSIGPRPLRAGQARPQ